MSSFAPRSTAMDELRVTAQVIAGLPTRSYAPDQWTVVFADFGHDLLVLGTLPTPASCTEVAEDLFAVLQAQNLSSYEVTAPSAAAAERRAREYFAAERIGVTSWSDTGPDAQPGTPIPAQGGPLAWRIASQAFAARGLTPYADADAGNTWLVIGPDKAFPGEGVPYGVLFVYNDADDEITVDRAPVSGSDVWRVAAGDGNGTEWDLMTRPISQLADCVEAISTWLATPQVTPSRTE
ncbi:hypothetical protein [Streptomyces noursei]|uniref:hypothetical protein n=1 Tax=Streptomyces noursei TaxID=1971 RepID=UPI0022A6939A|nr:hypothetical protein [Streptomyces noursei]MCZ1021461.1 hypothetical protein [Streptomyces noursei]